MFKRFLSREEASDYIDSLGALKQVINESGTVITMSDTAMAVIRKNAQSVHDRSGMSFQNLETGLLGQAADAYKVKHDWREGAEQMSLTEPDKYDLLYRGCAIEVKTFDIRGYKSEPDSLMAVPLRQFHDAERRYLFYIGNTRISVDAICIIGFVPRLWLECLERAGSISNYNVDGDHDYDNVVVKKHDEFVRIEHLDAAIDHMLNSTDKFLRRFTR